MMIEAKRLSVEELARIEEEWEDSKTITDLLGHIQYLSQAVIRLAGSDKENGHGRRNG